MVRSGHVTVPWGSLLLGAKRTLAGGESLQTDLQTNHAAQHGISGLDSFGVQLFESGVDLS